MVFMCTAGLVPSSTPVCDPPSPSCCLWGPLAPAHACARVRFRDGVDATAGDRAGVVGWPRRWGVRRGIWCALALPPPPPPPPPPPNILVPDGAAEAWPLGGWAPAGFVGAGARGSLRRRRRRCSCREVSADRNSRLWRQPSRCALSRRIMPQGAGGKSSGRKGKRGASTPYQPQTTLLLGSYKAQAARRQPPHATAKVCAWDLESRCD